MTRRRVSSLLRGTTVALLSVVLSAISLAQSAPGQPRMPELQFTDPPGFYRSAIYPPADFSSQEVNASLQVYPFRVVNGDIRQAFTRTLLRELIDGRYQETNILPGGRIDQMAMAGADSVLRARFQEGNYGQPREHLRVAVVRGNAVAIIDVSAMSMASWQRIAPRIDAFAATLNIAAGTPPPSYPSSPPSAAGQAFAGVYMALTTKYEALFGRRVPAMLYYVFSADGRAYRKYDDLSVPGNDPARFDFAAAQRADPVNSGRYTIQGKTIVVRLGPPSDPETFETTLPRGKTIVIRGLSFERQ